MANVTPAHVHDALYGKRGLGSVSEGTFNNYLVRLRGLFDFAISRGYCKEQLISKHRGVAPRKTSRRERWRPGPDVVLDMMEAAEDPSHRALIALLANTMGRSGEITELRVGDIDLDNGWIAYTVYKTKQQDRFPISSDLDVELRRWFRYYQNVLGRPLHDSDYVIPARVAGSMSAGESRTYRPDRPMGRPYLLIQRLFRAVGRDDVKGEGAHTIRRGMARAWFDLLAEHRGYEGALETVSAALHHSSVTMTEIYLGVEARRRKRDDSLHRQPLLTAMMEARAEDAAKVVSLVG
jgi:integrase